MAHDALIDDANQAVGKFIEKHRVAAIPALVAACVGWAVEHGAADLIRETLLNAAKMSFDADAVFKDALQ